MTIVVNGKMNTPNVTCLNADIIGGKVAGANPGMVVLASDTLAWYIVRSDSVLVPYALPVEITVDPGSINIGIVDQGAPTVGTAWPVSLADGKNIAEGTTTDTPSTDVETNTARTGISLWKGIKNYLKTIADKVGSNGLAVDALINKIEQSVAESTTVAHLVGTQDVATSGVAEPLIASSTKVISAIVFANTDNTGDIYLGTAAVNKTSSKQITMPPGSTFSIDVPLGFNFNLGSWYVDAEVNGEGVSWTAIR